MELKRVEKPNRTLVRLENDHEAQLFASDGLGLASIKGVRLAIKIINAQVDNRWPVEVTVSDSRLKRASGRMSSEAASLVENIALLSLEERRDGMADERTLRDMSNLITGHLEHS